MSSQKVRHPLSLVKYFVFNMEWGSREDMEHEKIIYYHHHGWKGAPDRDQQAADIGLAEAAINFGRQFGDAAESVQGDRMRFVFYQLSKTIWSAIFVNEPYTVHKSTDDPSGQISEYHQNEICDNFLKLKLKNIYDYFRLLNGPIEELCSNLKDRRQFLRKCWDFFDQHVPHLELIPFNFLELYSAIQYLPLSNTTFMSVQSLLNCIQAGDSSKIHGYIFTYNDQLVSSSLSLFDTQILYNYLTNIIIPDVVKDEISGSSINSTGSGTNKTRWLHQDLPIYLTGDKSFQSLSLFRSFNGSTVGLILSEYDDNLMKECEALLSSRLVSLTNKLHETVSQIQKQSTEPSGHGHRTSSTSSSISTSSSSDTGKDIKFIYMNHSNRAQRGNANCRKVVDGDFSRLIIDVQSDLFDDDSGGPFADDPVVELVGKNTSDAWLVTRNSDSRTLYALLNHKNANLIEASDMIDALQNKHLTNIFFGI